MLKDGPIQRSPAMKTAMRLVVAVALLVSGRFLQAGSLTVLHSFGGPPNDCEVPEAPLIQGSDGDFYGTASSLSSDMSGSGCVFKIDSTGTVTVLHAWGFAIAYPMAPLVQASDGFFYGTTSGDIYNFGTVFKIDSAGNFTSLHSFNGNDGANPQSALVEGTDGNFYGTTLGGGAHSRGTVFKMTPSGTVTTLHSFSSGDVGPVAGLIQASDGLFYGTTFSGGSHGKGSIFKISSSGAFTRLHSFNGNDGKYPQAVLLQASDGNFYGTTLDGGSHGVGVIFEVDSSGNFNVLVNLTNNAHPQAGLIQLPNGLLYGTTSTGGTQHHGAIFKVDPSNGNYTRIFSFSGSDGSGPEAGLLLGTDGLLYGTTAFGGTASLGVVFSFSTPISSPAISDMPADGGLPAEDE
jgi:uncharacterized repeat protein (TIGR03803 family)